MRNKLTSHLYRKHLKRIRRYIENMAMNNPHRLGHVDRTKAIESTSRALLNTLEIAHAPSGSDFPRDLIRDFNQAQLTQIEVTGQMLTIELDEIDGAI